MGRVLLGGLLGGIVMFGWGFLSHYVLQLTEKKMFRIPNEAQFMDVVKGSAKEPGIYRFPYPDPSVMKDTAAKEAFFDKYKAGPNGILVRGPEGDAVSDVRFMVMEFGSNVLAALIASIVLAALGARVAFPNKIMIVALMGAFAWLSQDASYMIWFGFPQAYSLSALVDAVAGWFIAGIAIAMVVKPSVPTKA